MDLSQLVDAGGAALSAVGGASLLAALLPRTPKLAWIYRLLDLLAANWMQARNAPTPAEAAAQHVGAGRQ